MCLAKLLDLGGVGIEDRNKFPTRLDQTAALAVDVVVVQSDGGKAEFTGAAGRFRLSLGRVIRAVRFLLHDFPPACSSRGNGGRGVTGRRGSKTATSGPSGNWTRWPRWPDW